MSKRIAWNNGDGCERMKLLKVATELSPFLQVLTYNKMFGQHLTVYAQAMVSARTLCRDLAVIKSPACDCGAEWRTIAHIVVCILTALQNFVIIIPSVLLDIRYYSYFWNCYIRNVLLFHTLNNISHTGNVLQVYGQNYIHSKLRCRLL